MQAIRLIEDKPPFCYQERQIVEHKIPILSEIGAILGWGVAAIVAMGLITIIKIDPKVCKPSEKFVNQSVFCKSAESINKFFYDYKEI